MGAVYLAEHALIGRRVAIKVLLPECGEPIPQIVQRFFNEARATTASSIRASSRSSTSATYADGRAYIVMEFLEGESLADAHRDAPSPLPGEAAAPRAADRAARWRPRTRKRHRPPRPQARQRLPRRAIPRRRAASAPRSSTSASPSWPARLRRGDAKTSARSMGTPTYMSPEQWGAVDERRPRADLYSLGCISSRCCRGARRSLPATRCSCCTRT